MTNSTLCKFMRNYIFIAVFNFIWIILGVFCGVLGYTLEIDYSQSALISVLMFFCLMLCVFFIVTGLVVFFFWSSRALREIKQMSHDLTK